MIPVLLTVFACTNVLMGIFVPFTIHVEFEFDSACVDPYPWWRPFMWWRKKKNERGFVYRVGILGFHVCIAFHYYDSSYRKHWT